MVCSVKPPECVSVLAHHNIKLVSMDHKISATICCNVHLALNNFHTAKMGAQIIAQKFIVITGNVNNIGALTDFAEQFLHHIIAGMRPLPSLFQRSSVKDVVDQAERFGIMTAQKIQQQFGLATLRTQMDIG